MAARYLRDTAENAALYLKDSHVDPAKLLEIERTYESSKHVVQTMSGKCRKFDDGWRPQKQQQQKDRRRRHQHRPQQQQPGYDHEFRRPAAPTAADTVTSHTRQHRRGDETELFPASGRAEHTTTTDPQRQRRRRSASPAARASPASRREYRASFRRGAACANVGAYQVEDGQEGDYQQQQQSQQPQNPRHRGPSGIPYGYASYRDVDSYRPGGS